eukprot:jgi/Chrzof1/13556/Cz08g02010.t1
MQVAYLSLGSWFDSRQEKADRQTRLSTPKPVAAGSSKPGGSPEEDDEQAKKRVRAKREKRGFGSMDQ